MGSERLARSDERVLELEAIVRDALRLAREIEVHCPCGARPETPHTHPHVCGCPTSKLITRLKEART